ncbi:MAG TPA: hypothetical protein VK215_13220 [Acidimicrobiales bacterium]|nr:hypothetical protein [Acidimicrobiales bacterium]HLN43413.1 hypothetical protein [Acidimicrobiales bacterium]
MRDVLWVPWTEMAEEQTPPAGSGADELRRDKAEWGERATSEPRWPALLAVVSAMALYFVLPDKLISGLGPRWLVPALEGVLGASLLIASPRLTRESRRLRPVAITLIACVNLANVVSLAELVHELLVHTHANHGGRDLIYASVPIWVTNVLVFALWYWELDRGGPVARLEVQRRQPDFLFPQMTAPDATRPNWSPAFVDYLFTSFTNATAFSPTDTMPLTPWAKILFMVQSLASLLTVALVVSRAVNILN